MGIGECSELVTLVLPCLDEERSIASCVVDARTAAGEAGIELEVVVVDNGSTDRSVEVARRAGARVVHESVRGYGSAVRRGIESANGSIVVMADADSTYELGALPRLVRPIVDGDADLVLGERLRSATNATMPVLHRAVGTPVLSALIRRGSGGRLAITDSQSGYRAFRRDDVLDLHLQSTGMEYASEMLVRAAQSGYRIAEVPTEYGSRVGASKLATFRDGMRHLELIVLLAPQVLLRVPGVVALATGIAAMIAGSLRPEGLTIGSGGWQPVFLAPILVVLGTLLILAAGAIRRFSPLAALTAAARPPGDSVAGRFALAGVVIGAAGLALDVVLSVVSFPPDEVLGRRLALASAATSALLVGATLLVAAVVEHLLNDQRAYVAKVDEARQRDGRACEPAS